MRVPVTVTFSVAETCCADAVLNAAEAVTSAATDVQSRSDVEIFMVSPFVFRLFVLATMASSRHFARALRASSWLEAERQRIARVTARMGCPCVTINTAVCGLGRMVFRYLIIPPNSSVHCRPGRRRKPPVFATATNNRARCVVRD
jgi:hypothetical protein